MIKRLKICSSVYDVDNTEERLIADGDTVLYGDIQQGERIIRIANGYPMALQLRTLLHECLHGISDEYGFEFDERTTDRLARAIYAFMIDNPEFIREIIGERNVVNYDNVMRYIDGAFNELVAGFPPEESKQRYKNKIKELLEPLLKDEHKGD